MPTIVQLTDLHLFADPAAELKGIATWDSLSNVLAHVRDHAEPFDRLVITGDLAHDERRETYVALRELLGDDVTRCRIVPGNHDDRVSIREVFPDVTPAGDGPLVFTERVGDWLIVGLDSHVPGAVTGRVESDQLEWLRAELASHSERPVLVFMHHPPFSVHSRWLDRLALEEPEPLLRVLRAAPHVRVVCTGHVHYAFAGRLGELETLTTPSTAFQFDPAGDEPHTSNAPPGYRVFHMDGDRLETKVVRVI